jgi:hypothetical protein
VNNPRGVAKNRYSSCFWENRFFARYGANNAVIGQIGYRVTILGRLNPGTRTFKYEAYVDNIVETNFPLGMDARLKIGFSISNNEGSPGGRADCKPDPNNLHREATFRQWRANGDNLVVEATFTSPHSTSKIKTDEQRDYCQVRGWAHYPDANYGPRGVTFRMKSNLRCDSALYIPKHGCVYDWSIPHLKLSFQQQYWQQLAHIWTALTHPDATFPTHIRKVRLDKDIPGGELHKRITRHADGNLNDANNKRSARFCRLRWGVNYAGRWALAHPRPDGSPGPQGECDEYPFKSTREGATHRNSNGKLLNNWSVLVIDGQQNGGWGSAVWGTWLGNERILDNDTLWLNKDGLYFPTNDD